MLVLLQIIVFRTCRRRLAKKSHCRSGQFGYLEEADGSHTVSFKTNGYNKFTIINLFTLSISGARTDQAGPAKEYLLKPPWHFPTCLDSKLRSLFSSAQ